VNYERGNCKGDEDDGSLDFSLVIMKQSLVDLLLGGNGER